MNKNEIIHTLTSNHKVFIDYTSALNKEQIEYKRENKWSAAQQIQHIYKSVRPLALGLLMPKVMVKIIWGKANRPSKSYEGLVAKYNEKLLLGGRASSPFVPKEVPANDIKKWQSKIETSVKKLCSNLEKYNEAEFDLYILPHPLLGKVTLREMMYFTMYHVQHHQQIIKRDCNKI
jgi:DinB superfamily